MVIFLNIEIVCSWIYGCGILLMHELIVCGWGMPMHEEVCVELRLCVCGWCMYVIEGVWLMYVWDWGYVADVCMRLKVCGWCMYEIADVCMRLKVYVWDWRCMYKIADVCMRLKVRVWYMILKIYEIKICGLSWGMWWGYVV